MQVLLPIHIAAGGLAIVLGAVALIVKKGGTTHRRSGLLFVYAMLVMGFSASIMGFLKNSINDTNVFVGFMTAYFVGTALTAVRPVSPWTRRIDAVALTGIVGLALGTIVSGVKAFNTPGPSPGGVPFRTIGVMSFVLATVMTLAAIGDVRILRSGMPRGGRRLARHLWRMCFALFIAAGSFFSIRERVAKILPEPFTSGPMRALPILLLFGAMFYWLWRVRRRAFAALERRGPHHPYPSSPDPSLPPSPGEEGKPKSRQSLRFLPWGGGAPLPVRGGSKSRRVTHQTFSFVGSTSLNSRVLGRPSPRMRKVNS
ncbi:MAG TPA: DUF2306 domain-containing protein [Thermoanaerobaculia bacterium]